MKTACIEDAEDHITPEALAGSATKIVPAGSVVFVMRSGILKHSLPVAVTRREVSLNQDLRALHPQPNVLPDFVAHYVRRAARDILHECSKDGTTVNSIDTGRLMSWPVPVPGLDVQRAITIRIDALFADIEDGEQALTEARAGVETYRKALLKAAVTGELTADWRLANPPAETGQDLLRRILAERRARWEADPKNRGKRYGKPTGPSASNLPELPEGWCWASVELAGDVQLGRQRAPQHHTGDHMRPYLRVANVLEARLDLRDVKHMNFSPSEFQVFSLRRGDVLLNEGQAPDLIGRPAIYDGSIDGCCFQKTLLRFRASHFVMPEYALALFRRYMHNDRFRREARITTNIGHLTQERFRPMEFPLPPMTEQQAIVKMLNHLEADAESYLSSSPFAPILRQSILAAAFRGDLVA